MLTLVLVASCSKPKENQIGTQDSSAAAQSILKLHWIGKKQLASEPTATNFMAIWNSPETGRLEGQTLEKLSTAPWRVLETPTALSNAPVALLRPLLDDLVQAESYLEVHGSTNRPGEIAFAIRLDSARAALWQSNLPVILKSLVAQTSEFKADTQAKGFSFQTAAFRFHLSHAGNWMLLAVSDLRFKNQDSRLLADFKNRIGRDGNPFPERKTNYWWEVQADAVMLSDAFQLGWQLPASFPDFSLTVTGDGQNVRTRGEINFPQPLPEVLPAWQVPLNLTAEPLKGLTVMRSVVPLLERLGIFSPDQRADVPEQFLLWLRTGPPLQIYFALQTENATNTFRKLALPITDWVNSHAHAPIYGSILLDTNLNDLKWNGLSLCAPNLKIGTNNSGGQCVQGGFGLLPPALIRLPHELHDHINQGTNLLFFDWELTAETLPQWRYLDDVSRMIFDGSHASRLRGSTNTLNWLLANVTNLSHSVTELRQSTSNQLVLTRRSTLGVNALELDLLLNWIEMPGFPSGMSTLWRTNPAPFLPVRLTNTPSASGN